jgi:multiple sugar transport system permease protein
VHWQSALRRFLIPSLLLLALVKLYPLGLSVYLSFFDYYLPEPERRAFIGLGNYGALLSEGRFWVSFTNTLIIAAAALALEFTVGLAVALGLYRLPVGAARVLTVLIFLPNIVTPVVAGLFLRWMFASQWGLIAMSFALLGIPPVDWLGNPAWAKVTIALADSWQQIPFVVLVLYAGLQGLDRDTIEAAVIDGASGWKLLWYVILPALRPVILFVLTIRIMDLFRLFDAIYVLTGGGPGTATETLTFYTYRLAFQFLEIGKGSALGVLTMIVITASIGGLILLLYRRERGAF